MKQDYSRYYGLIHPDTPEHWRQMIERMQRWLLPRLPATPGLRILDIGCGYGYALAGLRAAGFTAGCGIDADEGQTRFARKHALPVEHVEDTTAWLLGKPAAYDVALLLDVLEHIPKSDQPDFLRAVAATLRPGGKLILTTPNAAASQAGYWRYIDYTHHMSFTTESLGYLLTHAGFVRPEFFPIELLPASWTPRSLALRFFRSWRRLEYIAEFGRKGGGAVLVTPNFLTMVHKN